MQQPDASPAGWGKTDRGFPASHVHNSVGLSFALDRPSCGKIEDADRLMKWVQAYWAEVAKDLGPDVWGDPRNEWRQIGTKEISSATKKLEQVVNQAYGTPVYYEIRGPNNEHAQETNSRLHESSISQESRTAQQVQTFEEALARNKNKMSERWRKRRVRARRLKNQLSIGRDNQCATSQPQEFSIDEMEGRLSPWAPSMDSARSDMDLDTIPRKVDL